jgi:[acyl-carrier-protein] S-malonyltransferase
MKTALLSVGQGSQYVGMAKDICEKYPNAMDKVELADKALGFSIGNICFEGPADTLKETRYTQPALFLHSAIVIDALKTKIQYDAVAGHSVGEYAALYAAEVLDFETAIKLVALRGQLMFNAGEFEPGTMFAVIGADDAKAEELCKKLTDEGAGAVIVPANYNSPGQLVVSGSAEYLRAKAPEFKTVGAKIVKELAVSGAFHSPLMNPAKEELAKAINAADFKDAKCPVYSNVYAKPLIVANEIKEALISQLTAPVKWTQSMQAMSADGITRFIEVGPGKVLQGLTKRIIPSAENFGVDNVSELDSFIS